MGNVTSSNLRVNLKAQANALSDSTPIYKLIGVSGDGELIRLTKTAIKTKNFTQLDHFIKKDVVKYLYNEGRGENVRI